MRRITLGTFLGLKTTISPVGIVVYLILIPLLAWAAGRILPLTPAEAWLAGLASAPVLFASDWLHQWGHARAARRAGYPMLGMHYHSLFSASQYPADEPPLPARIHMQRALGGWWVNLLFGLLIAPLAFYLWPRGGVVGWLAGFTFACNFVGAPVVSLLPIDIPGTFTTDGGTLLHYWRKSREEKKRAG